MGRRRQHAANLVVVVPLVSLGRMISLSLKRLSGFAGCRAIECDEVDNGVNRTEAWFDGLYRQTYLPVLAFCVRRTGRSDADDAVSEVFAVAWRRRHDIPDAEKALPWLYGVARNVLSHHWRSKARLRRLRERLGRIPRQYHPSPESVVIEDPELIGVRVALNRLRTGDQEVLRLAAWEGLSHREIAGVLGCSPIAVDKRLQRAKRRLRDQYQAMQPTQERPPATATGGGEASEYD